MKSLKKFIAGAAVTASVVASLGLAAPANAAEKNSAQSASHSALLDSISVPDAAQVPTTGDRPDVSVFLDPGTIGLCNAGWGDVSVKRIENAKGLGTIDLRCGDKSAGYVHIRDRHQGQWQDRINQVGRGGLWDDLMVFATDQSVRFPKAGYPKNVGDNKWCYSTLIVMSGPRGTIQYNPTVLVSTNNKKVITSYPTTNSAC